MVGVHCFRRVVMAQMFTLFDEESETPKDRQDDFDQSKAGSPQRKQLLAVPDQLERQRVQSMDSMMTFRQAEQPWRARLKSAPPALYAAVKYGRQLRRITDEFDVLLDKRMIRMWNSRAVSQKWQFPMFLSFLWSHKESDAETRSH